MTTLVLRTTKGQALTWAEVDDNFSNLNNSKLESISADINPSLGGDLDVSNYSIISGATSNITLTPGAGGYIVLSGLTWPSSDGSVDQYLKTDGAGNLSWGTPAGGAGSINFDGGSPSSIYTNGPAFDCGGVN